MSANKLLQAAAGNAGESIYVEDVFSTFLYEGNQTARSINNGLDLSGEGGLVWLKNREQAQNNYLFDTENGANKFVLPDSTSTLQTVSNRGVTAFNSNGFDLGTSTGGNRTGYDYVSWSFRKQAGFFDVVTYTGDGTDGRAIAHSLDCKPAMIAIKNLSASSDWAVWSKTYDVNEYDSGFLKLNTTDAATYTGTPFVSQLNVGSRDPSANFYVKNNSLTNTNGQNYVAYLFADGDDTNAQIFGDSSNEAIIKCGSYTGDGGNQTISLGFEPQWVLIKRTTATDYYGWQLYDSMRGLPVGSADAYLRANLSNAELSYNDVDVTPTGMIVNQPSASGGVNSNGSTYIYVAIRRPMKTPEAATEVFDTNNYVGNDVANRALTSGFVTDLNIFKGEVGNAPSWFDRLRGSGKKLESSANGAESDRTICSFDVQDGIYMPNAYGENNYNHPSYTDNYGYINYQFRRATGFLDIGAYSGNGTSGRSITHNLGVTPELMIIKKRNGVGVWQVAHKDVWGSDKSLYLNLDSAAGSGTFSYYFYQAPTSSVFYVTNQSAVNGSGDTFVAYLFATVAGISKVGSYSGTGSDINVDCGFSAGARFVMVKRTDSTGDWYFWDTDRGIVAGNDSYMFFNDNAGENTSNDYIDPLSSGFTITSSAPAALNASGGTYIFLAIA